MGVVGLILAAGFLVIRILRIGRCVRVRMAGVETVRGTSGILNGRDVLPDPGIGRGFIGGPGDIRPGPDCERYR